MGSRGFNDDNKVYVGGLPADATAEEDIKCQLEDSFSKYGKLRNVWVARQPPGFAFVHFDDIRDAEDAVRGLDGTKVCGNRVRVEMSHSRGGRGGGRGGGGGGGFGRGNRGGGDRDRYDRRSRSRSPARRYSRSTSRSPPPRRPVSRSRSRSRD